jgi:hypothetical protein
MDKEQIQKDIDNLEQEMSSADFWSNKDKAQATIKRIQELKNELLRNQKYDAG